MRIFQAIKLAKTKLRVHKIMTWLVVMVSSLMFAVLIAGIIVYGGFKTSTEKLTREILDNKYLVSVHPIESRVFLTGEPLDNLEEVRRVKKFEQEYFSKLKTKYQELGLEYDEKNEISLLKPDALKSENRNLPVELHVSWNFSSPVYVEYEKLRTLEFREKHKNKFEDLKELGDKYGAKNYYKKYGAKLKTLPNTRLIENGKEDFSVNEMRRAVDSADLTSFKNSAYNSEYVFADQEILKRYLVESNVENLEGIPVIITPQEAARMYGKEVGVAEEEPEDLAEKISWLSQIREKIVGKTYQACHRNEAEQKMLDKIQSDFVEMKTYQGTERYVEPKLQYGYPELACGDIIVKKDVRSEDEKNEENKQKEILKKLGNFEEPRHEILTFQIVGLINPSEQVRKVQNIEDYLKNLVIMDDYQSAIIPIQMYEGLVEDRRSRLLKWEGEEGQEVNDYAGRIVEFSDLESAKKFLEEAVDREADRYREGYVKEFKGEIFGANYLALSEIEKVFYNVMILVFPAIMIVALIIIWFMVAKIVSESRKETAIYRAMGAKRRDIMKIYLYYVMILSVRIIIMAMATGMVGAKVVDGFYGSELTRLMQSILGVNYEVRVSLFELSPMVGVIGMVIFGICVVAAVVPIYVNTLRQPIRDMREE